MRNKTILFDLMDTLVVGAEKPRAKVYRTLGFATLDEFDECGEAVTVERPGLSAPGFLAALYEWRGIQPDEDAIAVASSLWYNSFDNMHFIEGALDCLSVLRSRGYRTAILSNSYPPTHRLISRLELYNLVDRVFLSCDVGAWKPSAAAYNISLQAMGVSPECVCMVGNRISTDVVGAISAGIAPILFKPDRPSTPIFVQGQRVPLARSIMQVASLVEDLDVERKGASPWRASS